MELWIRSQDRKCLIKAKIIKWENGCLRGATDDDGWYYDLGKYKKERALEVLDEIQNILKPQLIVKEKEDLEIHNFKIELVRVPQLEYDVKEIDTYVYEMPLD